MRIIFKKSHLPFLKNTLHYGKGRDFWTLSHYMHKEDGIQRQIPAQIALLQKGVEADDPWAMCGLARIYFDSCGDTFLPLALRLLSRAVRFDDPGAKWDVEHLNIHSRIMGYKSPDGNAYNEMEMKCAMLTEWHLTRLGYSPWESVDAKEKKRRIDALMKDASRVLQIPDTPAELVPGLCRRNGHILDGQADWSGTILVRTELIDDYERLIEIIFHEIGHVITFEMLKNTSHAAYLRKIYGISGDRMKSWGKDGTNYGSPTSEEDPDTLAYGVYTMWATFFCMP